MNRSQATKICTFIENHYDYVDQEQYFELCEMLLDIVCDDANKGGYAESLVRDFPDFFDAKPPYESYSLRP